MKTTIFSLYWLCLLLGGCATYHPQIITQGAVEKSLQSPSWKTLKVKASQISHPILHPIRLDPSDGLSPQEGAIVAILANPALRALRRERKIASAQLLQAGILPNPQISYGVNLPSFGITQGSFVAHGAGLSLDLQSLITRRASVDSAFFNGRKINLQIAWQEWQVAESAKFQIYRIYFLQKQIALAQTIQDKAEISLLVMMNAVDLGQKTKLELVAHRAYLQEIDLAFLSLKQALDQAKLELNRILGFPPGAKIAIETKLSLAQNSFSLSELMHNIEGRRLDIMALKKGYSAQEEAVRKAILSQFPQIQIGFNSASDTSKVGTLGFGIALSLPIFDRNQGNIAIERATREKLFYEYMNRIFQTRANIALLISKIQFARSREKLLKNNLSRFKDLVKIYQKALKIGSGNLISFYQIQNQYFQKQIKLWRVRQAISEFLIALEVAGGQIIIPQQEKKK